MSVARTGYRVVRTKGHLPHKTLVGVSFTLDGFAPIAGVDKANRSVERVPFVPKSGSATLVSVDDGASWVTQVEVYGDRVIGFRVYGFARWSGALDELPEWLAAILRAQLTELEVTPS